MADQAQAKVDEMYADFNRQREAFAEASRDIATGTFTVTAKRRAFQVTVDGQGNLTEIKFLTGAYRTMPGAELGSLLLETITAARRQAVDAGIAHFERLMPAQLPLTEILGGSFDGDKMFADALRAIDELRAAGPDAGEKDHA
ncbi:YbaB/EbfC family nucleoid-associated protein [Micromonospora sp. NPDC093277]|uniref:YbaB/EbfC family nucleoid-associated protein n=1 Tax=Micromonospora sp. NPDC093277 TaxID=3364291 RepID=UPI003805DF4F